MRHGKCPRCDQAVAWVPTPSGRRISIELQQDPLGTLYLDEKGIARQVKKDLGRSVPRWVSHLTVCPDLVGT